MKATVLSVLCLAVALGPLSSAAAGEAPSPIPTVSEKVVGMEPREGLLQFHIDQAGGKIWLVVPPPDGPRGVALELLYVEGLRTGLGSNPVGLDRGRLGETRWIHLRRVGPRVFVEQLNPRYRARSDDPVERRAAHESFATSILWGGEIAALDADGRTLVDFTSFLVRDAHGIVGALAETDQGHFELDPGRSVVDFEQCLAFPDNVELESLLTFSGQEPGPHVRQTAPDPQAVTFVHHTSFLRLPDDGYRPRSFDPRAGSFGIEFHDYAVELDAPYRQQWIVRHRLEKTDPSAERSRVVEPIVFYVDRGAPEPVRSALVEGAGWWAAAFEAAGFEDAYRVELLPLEAHPLDARYNVIEWVHRSTRGWSMGGGIVDPRTGEMLKGHVRLGSLRVRQDRLLFEGLVGAGKSGSGDADDPVEMALARIRQLAAHEVGHSLGFSHNFAASTYADRASVMDYPAPLIEFRSSGEFDFSRVYGIGVGAWDRHAVRYAYTQFASEADERVALDAIVREGLDAGYLFLTDSAARPAGASDPRANLWDNGTDPVTALENSLRVRRHALDGFGERNIPEGAPLAHLDEVLATVYFHHRFQLDAAVKVVGGMEFTYAIRGDGQEPTVIVPGDRQRRALDAVLKILRPAELDLPDSVLELLAPRPGGESRNPEMFASTTSPAFDLQGAVATAAAAVVDGLLQGERLARAAEFHRRDTQLPGVGEILYRLTDRTFSRTPERTERLADLRRVVQIVVVQRLIGLAENATVSPIVRASAEATLRRVREGFMRGASDAHTEYVAAWISRFLDRPAAAPPESWAPPAMPPGSPIGSPRLGCSQPS